MTLSETFKLILLMPTVALLIKVPLFVVINDKIIETFSPLSKEPFKIHLFEAASNVQFPTSGLQP